MKHFRNLSPRIKCYELQKDPPYQNQNKYISNGNEKMRVDNIKPVS